MQESDMNDVELLRGIDKLRKERSAVILAHNYQIPQIQDLADFVGDSLDMARYGLSVEVPVVVVAGVRFMAETVKILCPEKTVLAPSMAAGCPLADSLSAKDIRKLKEEYEGATVVSYVNSSAEVKAESDICCTSSNALNVVRSLENKDVLFVPDKNLGRFVQIHAPEKNVITWTGSCPVHDGLTFEEVAQAKNDHPDALVLAHPECNEKVLSLADFVGSTSQIIGEAQRSDAKEFIIATELGVLHALEAVSTRYGETKHFYPASTRLVCADMKEITLEDIYNSLKNMEYEIFLPEAIMEAASRSLWRMLSLH